MLQGFDKSQFRIETISGKILGQLASSSGSGSWELAFEKRHGRRGRVGPVHKPSRLLSTE